MDHVDHVKGLIDQLQAGGLAANSPSLHMEVERFTYLLIFGGMYNRQFLSGL